jgi:hypothetical protein
MNPWVPQNSEMSWPDVQQRSLPSISKWIWNKRMLLRKAKHHNLSHFCMKYNSDTWNLKYNYCCLRWLYHQEGQRIRRRRSNVTGWDVMAVIMANTRRKCSNRKRTEQRSVTMATHSRCNIFVPSRSCHRKYGDTSRASQTSGNYLAANINGSPTKPTCSLHLSVAVQTGTNVSEEPTTPPSSEYYLLPCS